MSYCLVATHELIAVASFAAEFRLSALGWQRASAVVERAISSRGSGALLPEVCGFLLGKGSGSLSGRF